MPDEEPQKPYEPPVGVSRDLTFGRTACTVHADWLVLKKREKPQADVFHVFYGKPGDEARPVTFVFNGGPGASSAYLHMAAIGPRRVAFNADGTLLPPPARLVDNAESWFAWSDLVFVDPVGTGFSRAVDKPAPDKKDEPPENKEFFELNRDLQALCEFISRFLSRHRLWSRPIFIAGESYGGFRVARLARKLQESYGVGLNGALLISPALEISLLHGSDYDALKWCDVFPAMALAAHHHGRGRVQAQELRAEAERFAGEELVVLLTQGEALSEAQRRTTCDRVADFLGLEREFVWSQGGRISNEAFTRHLLKDRRLVCGKYDASITAIDPFPDRENYVGSDPTLFAIERVFTTAINVHLRETLQLDTERDYRLLSLDVNEAWKVEGKEHVFDMPVGATDDLRYGMGLNPHMRVFICNGVFDLITPYFSSQRLTRLMKLHPSQQEHVTFRAYQGGHMFYTWEASRRAFAQDVRAFYQTALTS